MIYSLKVSGWRTDEQSIKTEYVVRADSAAKAIAYGLLLAHNDGIAHPMVTKFFRTAQAAYRDGILIYATDGSVQENTIHRDFAAKIDKKEWMEAMLRNMI